MNFEVRSHLIFRADFWTSTFPRVRKIGSMRASVIRDTISVFDREVSMNEFIVSGRPGKLQEITVGDAESWHGMAGDDG